jgi:RNA polymerase sigma factor (sigma-70 family)
MPFFSSKRAATGFSRVLSRRNCQNRSMPPPLATDWGAAPRGPAAEAHTLPPAGSPDAHPGTDEFALMRRVTAKERQAFEALYQRYYPRLLSYLVKFLGCRALAEEVLDDVMLVVWREASRFRYQSRVSTWIFGIAYYKALKARTKTLAPSPGSPSPADALPDHEDPAETLIRQEIHSALGHTIQALPPEQRAVVELTFYHGFSYSEIAAMTGCPVNTVKTRMRYARTRLAQLLPEV